MERHTFMHPDIHVLRDVSNLFFFQVQVKLHVQNRKKSKVLLSSYRHSKKCLWPLWNVLKVNTSHATGGQPVLKVRRILNRSNMRDSQTYTQTASIYWMTTTKKHSAILSWITFMHVCYRSPSHAKTAEALSLPSDAQQEAMLGFFYYYWRGGYK